ADAAAAEASAQMHYAYVVPRPQVPVPLRIRVPPVRADIAAAEVGSAGIHIELQRRRARRHVRRGKHPVLRDDDARRRESTAARRAEDLAYAVIGRGVGKVYVVGAR